MKSKEEVLREAREHIAASKKFAAQVPPVEDLVSAYRNDSYARMKAERDARAERQRAEKRERRTAERNAAGHEQLAELRAELDALRAAIAKGDAAVLDSVSSHLLPLFDRVADRLDEVSARVDRKLAELESLVRGSIAAPGGTVHELPRRNVN